MNKGKQSKFWYRMTRFVAGVVSRFIFKRKYIRNEIRGKKGPLVIIANHQASLDFVNLMGATRRLMTFVVSNSFYNTLPVKGIMDKIKVIPKQQFQTELPELKRMKRAIEDGKILVIYPTGLMSEDGLSTPIPHGTYKFLKWIKADIYVARTYGMYFSMPKWTKGMRKGNTYLDIYKLFSKEEAAAADMETLKVKTEEALLFDAYREQEKFLVKYKKNDHIMGLENVLYMCPHCKKEFTVKVRDKRVIYCESCGYEQVADKYGFFHNNKGVGDEIRYVSDWSRFIYSELKDALLKDENYCISSNAEIQMIDYKNKRFAPVGEGMVSLSNGKFNLSGIINGENIDLNIPTVSFASLPFKPGKHIEIQHGNDIYRCVLKDGHLAMKFINMVKIYYDIHTYIKKA